MSFDSWDFNHPQFVKPLEDRYICVTCRNTLRDPVQSTCGHRFCKVCVDIVLSSPDRKCPADGEVLDESCVFRDRCALREISELQCYCPQRQHGCKWVGSFAGLETHQRECSFAKVSCVYVSQGCDRVLFRCQVAKHVENECVFRPVRCMHCHGEFPETRLSEHIEKCPKCPLECPNGCEAKTLLREQLEAHVLTECPLASTDCSFRWMGCDYRGAKISIHDHISCEETKHLILAGKSAEESQVKLRNLELQLASFIEKNRLLENQVASQNDALACAQETLTIQEVKLAKVEEFVLSHKEALAELAAKMGEASGLGDTAHEEVNALMVKLKAHEDRLSELKDLSTQNQYRSNSPNRDILLRRLEQLEHALSLQSAQLTRQEQNILFLEATTFDGSFIWKIDNYKTRFQESASGVTPSIYSTPFYTGRFGYKVCARVYLYGDGIGKGSYLSLFIVVMRGEYDALLSWPFRKKVTLKILDQDKIQDITETFRPDSSSSSFQRPKSDMNIASGCPKFCPHSLLKTRGYTRDNCLFIKVVFDKNGVTAM